MKANSNCDKKVVVMHDNKDEMGQIQKSDANENNNETFKNNVEENLEVCHDDDVDSKDKECHPESSESSDNLEFCTVVVAITLCPVMIQQMICHLTKVSIFYLAGQMLPNHHRTSRLGTNILKPFMHFTKYTII